VPETVLPTPARLSPVRDDHAWPFAIISSGRSHVRLRAWPTKDGGTLAIATDLMLGAGLVNDAEALCRAVAREFGDEAVVVRHFPVWSMLARDNDVFHLLTLAEKGTACIQPCTEEVLDLLGASVLGFPGDAPPGPAEAGAAVVPPQSVHAARALAALLRLTETRTGEPRKDGLPRHEPVAEADLEPLSHLKLGVAALEHLAWFLREADVDEHESRAGTKREKKLEKITETLHQQAWELTFLADEMVAEQRER